MPTKIVEGKSTVIDGPDAVEIVNAAPNTVLLGGRYIQLGGYKVPEDYFEPKWGTQEWHQHIPEFSQKHWSELAEQAQATFATNAQITVDNFRRISQEQHDHIAGNQRSQGEAT